MRKKHLSRNGLEAGPPTKTGPRERPLTAADREVALDLRVDSLNLR